jgi:hypothetical protein
MQWTRQLDAADLPWEGACAIAFSETPEVPANEERPNDPPRTVPRPTIWKELRAMSYPQMPQKNDPQELKQERREDDRERKDDRKP